MQYTYCETKHIKYFICNRFGIREGNFCSLQERSINAGTLTVNYEKVKEKIEENYHPNSNHIETNIVQFRSLISLHCICQKFQILLSIPVPFRDKSHYPFLFCPNSNRQNFHTYKSHIVNSHHLNHRADPERSNPHGQPFSWRK